MRILSKRFDDSFVLCALDIVMYSLVWLNILGIFVFAKAGPWREQLIYKIHNLVVFSAFVFVSVVKRTTVFRYVVFLMATL